MLTDDQQLLISAYVDGEATPDERARAEQLLVDDAQARSYREELLSMSADLQALPKHRLSGDFADQVLAAAEREMFVGTPWPAEQVESSTSSRQRWSRRIAYAAATIAAAVLVAIFLPKGDQPIAHNTADKPAAPAANQTPVKAPGNGEASRANGLVENRGEHDLIGDNARKRVPGGFGKATLGNSSQEGDALLQGANSTPPPAQPADKALGGRNQPAPAPRGESHHTIAPKAPKTIASPGSLQERRQLDLGAEQFLAATYDVQVKKVAKQVEYRDPRGVDEAVIRKARRRLAANNVRWTESTNKYHGNGVDAEGTLDQRWHAALRGQSKAAQQHAEAEPVVLYIEATPAQAQMLLANLDNDPAFRRDIALSRDALLTEKLPRRSATGFGGGGSGGVVLNERKVGRDDPKKTDAVEKEEDRTKARGNKDAKAKMARNAIAEKLRAYRLSRTDSLEIADSQEAAGPNLGAATETKPKAKGAESVSKSSDKPVQRDGDKDGAGATTKQGETSHAGAKNPNGASEGAGKAPVETATGRLVLVFRLVESAQEISTASQRATQSQDHVEATSNLKTQPAPAAKRVEDSAHEAKQ